MRPTTGFSFWPTPWRENRGRAAVLEGSLPAGLYRLVWRLSGGDQVWLCILSGLVAVLNTVPIEIQRRVIDRSLKGGSFRSVPWFVLAYAAVVILQGSLKLLFNVYRSWVSEHAVRTLRSYVNRTEAKRDDAGAGDPADQGTQVSMVIAESEPIGAFMGESVSEPVMQAGVMLSVGGYLVYIQPLMMLVVAAVFLPQFVFIPLMQRAVTRRAKLRIAMLRSAGGAVVDGENGTGKQTRQDARFAKVFVLNMGIYKFKYSMNFLTNLCHQLGIAGILGVGGWLVVHGKTEVGTVVAFISGLGTVKDPWDDLTTWFQTLMTTRARYRLFRDGVNKAAAASEITEPSQAPAARAEAGAD